MAEETAEKLLVDVARMDPEGEDFAGEADVIDLDEKFVKPFGPVRYRLHAQLFGNELLVRGSLEQDFDLVCSRCGRTFDTSIRVEDYTVSLEVADGQQFADLTTDARESIILTLPTYPLCSEGCRGIAQKREEVRDDRWNALDGLKVDRNT